MALQKVELKYIITWDAEKGICLFCVFLPWGGGEGGGGGWGERKIKQTNKTKQNKTKQNKERKEKEKKQQNK